MEISNPLLSIIFRLRTPFFDSKRIEERISFAMMYDFFYLSVNNISINNIAHIINFIKTFL